jgi:hypothetical protein
LAAVLDRAGGAGAGRAGGRDVLEAVAVFVGLAVRVVFGVRVFDAVARAAAGFAPRVRAGVGAVRRAVLRGAGRAFRGAAPRVLAREVAVLRAPDEVRRRAAWRGFFLRAAIGDLRRWLTLIC